MVDLIHKPNSLSAKATRSFICAVFTAPGKYALRSLPTSGPVETLALSAAPQKSRAPAKVVRLTGHALSNRNAKKISFRRRFHGATTQRHHSDRPFATTLRRSNAMRATQDSRRHFAHRKSVRASRFAPRAKIDRLHEHDSGWNHITCVLTDASEFFNRPSIIAALTDSFALLLLPFPWRSRNRRQWIAGLTRGPSAVNVSSSRFA